MTASSPESRFSTCCVIVNYRTPIDMLEQCLDSILGADAGNECRIVLVDNASGDNVFDEVRKRYPQVRTIEMPENAGFAAAVNRGIEEASEPYILLLNTDAVLTPGALESMKSALEAAGPDCAGIAPKMMSSVHEGIIDAVGTVMPPNGASFNRGIGQCDLGQYDHRDEVFGTCFGASLLRRGLFDHDGIGPLYEGYFLYFEDSDWCLRARSQGYRFLVEPGAVVHHLHSGVTRNESLDLKYGLIELNTLKMVTRNFESRVRVLRIVSARCLRLLARTFIRRKFIGPNLKTLASYFGGLRQLLDERRELRSKRIVSDAAIFRMADGENAYFDTVAYQPDRCLDSLIDTYLRLLKKERDPELGKLLAALYRMNRDELTAIDADTAELFAGQPPCVQNLLAGAATGE